MASPEPSRLATTNHRTTSTMTSESGYSGSPGTMPWMEPVSVTLTTMPQQAKMLSPDDDWTGKSSPAERRKRQNRLNQREYRKRKEMQKPKYSSPVGSNESPSAGSPEVLTPARNSNGALRHVHQDTGLWETFHSAAATPRFDTHALSRTAVLCKSTSSQNQRILSELENWIISNRHSGSPGADQLLVLVKFNVGMSDDALSPFTNTSVRQNLTLTIPSSLHPTELQCQIPHHPWIDLLPIPRMRDNLLRAGDSYDDIELCGDLVGYFNSPIARTGMVIWGDPWDVEGWEVTEQFLRRWGWTIRGCWKLFESTNRWREKRGERPLRFDGLVCDDLGT